VLLYAARIAAARLLARKDEADAMVLALQMEEQAALAALQNVESAEIARRRRNSVSRRFQRAAHDLTQTACHPPRRLRMLRPRQQTPRP
jgi:hypothetical protein